MSKKETSEITNCFDRFNPYLEEKLNRDIEENRKGQFSLSFKDDKGNFLDNVKVRVKLKNHEFKFGCSLFMLDCFSDGRDEIYREKFKKVFNYSVLPLYWDTLEPEKGKPRFEKNSSFVMRRPPLDSIVEYCNDNNIRMKGHCLVYNSFQPSWISNSNREIKIDIDKRLQAISDRYKYFLDDVDVINEMFTIYKNCYKGNGARNLQITDEAEHEKWCFDLCDRYFPFSRQFWNEGIMETFANENYRGNKSVYYLMLKNQINKGCKIGGIGMQYHLYSGNREDYLALVNDVSNPLKLIDVFECYDGFNLPIHISEVSVPSWSNEKDDEETQAILLKKLYKLWFGRKNIESIVWWNLADKTAYQTENKFYSGLLRNDCTNKLAYDVVDELINKEWSTETEGVANGTMNFRGFYGTYTVEAEYNGRKFLKEIRLFKENTGYDNRLCDFRCTNIELS